MWNILRHNGKYSQWSNQLWIQYFLMLPENGARKALSIAFSIFLKIRPLSRWPWGSFENCLFPYVGVGEFNRMPLTRVGSDRSWRCKGPPWHPLITQFVSYKSPYAHHSWYTNSIKLASRSYFSGFRKVAASNTCYMNYGAWRLP